MFNFALVGCGGMANWHAQQLQQIKDVNVAALVDVAPGATAKFKQQYFDQAVEFSSYEALLNDSRLKLDAVVLVTPHTSHFPQAKAALERGINVLVEKPMVTSSRDAYVLWDTVKRTKKLLGITYQSPYTQEFQYLARQRDAGELGKVQIISCWLAQNWKDFTTGTWRQDPTQSGGGMMYDSGAHALNALMWLMNDPVVEVSCFYDKCNTPVDINGVAIAKFQNGTLASIGIGGNCAQFRNEIIIQTDKYLIITDQYGSKLEMTAANGKRVYPHVEQALSTPAAGTPHLNFVNAMKGIEPLRAPVRYGVLLSALMDAMYESAEKGMIVKVKPVPRE